MAPVHAPHLLVDAHAPQPQLHAAIAAACRELLPGWAALPDGGIEVSAITGGISNALYKVAPAPAALAATLAPAAFRIFGDNTERFLDRDRELATMQLAHEHGFGPQVRSWGLVRASCEPQRAGRVADRAWSAAPSTRSCWPSLATAASRSSCTCGRWR